MFSDPSGLIRIHRRADGWVEADLGPEDNHPQDLEALEYCYDGFRLAWNQAIEQLRDGQITQWQYDTILQLAGDALEHCLVFEVGFTVVQWTREFMEDVGDGLNEFASWVGRNVPTRKELHDALPDAPSIRYPSAKEIVGGVGLGLIIGAVLEGVQAPVKVTAGVIGGLLEVELGPPQFDANGVPNMQS